MTIPVPAVDVVGDRLQDEGSQDAWHGYVGGAVAFGDGDDSQVCRLPPAIWMVCSGGTVVGFQPGGLWSGARMSMAWLSLVRTKRWRRLPSMDGSGSKPRSRTTATAVRSALEDVMRLPRTSMSWDARVGVRPAARPCGAGLLRSRGPVLGLGRERQPAKVVPWWVRRPVTVHAGQSWPAATQRNRPDDDILSASFASSRLKNSGSHRPPIHSLRSS